MNKFFYEFYKRCKFVNSNYLYRLTSQKPHEVIAKGGFHCTDAYANCLPEIHVTQGGLSNWISTTRNINSLLNVSSCSTIYIYTIKTGTLETLPIDYSGNGLISLYKAENEVLVKHHIPLSNIIHCQYGTYSANQWNIQDIPNWDNPPTETIATKHY